MSQPQFAIGVDIGGGSTKIGLVSSAGNIVDRARVVIDKADGADRIIEKYAVAIRDITSRNAHAKPIGIGIGFPGPIHPGNMSGTFSNIAALDDVPLAERLGSLFSLPARMENDGTAAGMAEAMFGEHRDAARLLLVAAGTGIGVALAVDGRPFSTSGGCLGDAGHLIVDAQSTRRCRQGCLGCLETVASGEALNAMAQAYVCDNPESAIGRHAMERDKPADASDVIVCARHGDAAAVTMIEEIGRWLGRGAATWAHIFAPSVILLGGGLSAAGELLLKPLEMEARRCGLELYLRDVRFSLASLGNDAGMIGAAAQIFLNTRK